MALSGSYEQSFSGSPSTRLYVEWSAVQNPLGNYSEITQIVYIKYYSYKTNNAKDIYASVNGGTEAHATVPPFGSTSSPNIEKSYQVLTQNSVRVNHDSSGKAENIPLQARFVISIVPGGPTEQVVASTAVTLDPIDQATPTVSFTLSNIDSVGFVINAVSNESCDIWDYSVDNGSNWTNFSTTDGVSSSITVTGLIPNTSYTVKVKARKTSNQLYGYSSAITVSTEGSSALISVDTLEADITTPIITFRYSCFSSSFTHSLLVKNGSTTILTLSVSLSLGTNQQTTYTLTSSEVTALLTAMTALQNFTATYELKTYSSGTQVGTSSIKTGLVTTDPTISSPTMTGVSYADIDTSVTAITGSSTAIVQGKSKLQVTINGATAKNGATIASYTVTVDDVSVSNSTNVVVLGTIPTPGSKRINVTVADSRGYMVSYSSSFTVIAFEDVKITSLDVGRNNGYDTVLNINLSGTISPVTVSSVNKNTLQSVRYRYKKTNESTFNNWTSIVATSTSTTFAYTNNNWISLDINYSYDLEIMATDNFGSYTVAVIVPQGTPLVSFRQKKLGINNPSPTVSLDVNGEIKMNSFYISGFITELASDVNLNSLVSGGIYSQSTAANAVTGYNYPVNGVIGILEVLASTNIVTQRYTSADMTDIYFRSYYNSSWTAWKKLTPQSMAIRTTFIETAEGQRLLTENGDCIITEDSPEESKSGETKGEQTRDSSTGVKISQLPTETTLSSSYYMPFATSEETVKVSYSTLVSEVTGDISVDYSNATNKPQIEGVTLSGNKTLDDLNFTSLTNNDIDEIVAN